MIRRTIREWERIGYGEDENEIPPPQADRIAAVAQVSDFSGRGGDGVLEHGRRGLRARGVVGVIATSDCQLEILPKIEGAGESGVSLCTVRNLRPAHDEIIVATSVSRDAGIQLYGCTAAGFSLRWR